MKHLLLFLFPFCFLGCTNSALDEMTSSGSNILSVNAKVHHNPTKSIITGSYFPDKTSIGVFLKDQNGGNYDNLSYNNVMFASSGEGTAQTWNGSPILLSSTVGRAVAYYPYDAAVTDYTNLPVKAGTDNDYMYSGVIGQLSNANPSANFTMKHALTGINVFLKKGSYTGPGNVTSVEISSEGFGNYGILNAGTGGLSDIAGKNTSIQNTINMNLTSGGTDNFLMVVPDVSVKAKPITIKVTIDGTSYTKTCNMATEYKQGYIYKFPLTLNATGLSVSQVSVEQWTVQTMPEGELEIVKPGKKYIIDIDITSGSVFYSNVMGFTGTIDWGDGTVTTHKDEDHPSHTYRSASYTVTHEGTCSALSFLSKKSSAACVTAIREIGGGLGITDMERAFAKCSRLISLDPAILDELTQVTNFSCAFLECTALSGESPYTLINGKKVHLYERTNYTTYFKSPTSYSNCFYECKSLDDYLTMPDSWARNGHPEPDGGIVLPGGDGEIIISNH